MLERILSLHANSYPQAPVNQHGPLPAQGTGDYPMELRAINQPTYGLFPNPIFPFVNSPNHLRSLNILKLFQNNSKRLAECCSRAESYQACHRRIGIL